MKDQCQMPLTSNHWGTYRVEVENGLVKALHPFEQDVDPSPIGPGIVDVLDGPTRITAPMVRQSWLEGGPGAAGDKRGKEPFVKVSWEYAEKLVADELNRVRHRFGNEAIFAGSYGWASAGRFHHAKGQMRRFLNCIGGFTQSVNTYSLAAGEVIIDHVLGSFRDLMYHQTDWRNIVDHTELFVAFGGVPLKNGQIGQGGVGRHRQREAMQQAIAANVRFVNISPLREDVMEGADADWLALRPSTDTALLLGLMHTLLVEGLHDQGFLDRYTVGFADFAASLRGQTDGIEKTADWAGEICGLPPDEIHALARRMARSRTMISLSWSLTRQDHGEQPFWAGVVLAAMLGQIGLPGGGVGFGYSAVNTVGLEHRSPKYAALPQGRNPVASFIPVARIAAMLENPGGQFDYNGQSLVYPDTKLIYWAGGNPFHHHQDLNRMRRAWARPDTIIVHEWCWNTHAKHADIVLPCTTPLERHDLALAPHDPFIIAMEQAIAPVGQARDDFEVFRNLARHMGVEQEFTEGRDADDWLRWIYDTSRQEVAKDGIELPPIDDLWARGWHKVEPTDHHTVMLSAFRADPAQNPLKTPSGRIEVLSKTIAGFGYEDCPPFPSWMEPAEWLGAANPAQPLHLISNQPKTKLHSHLDHGSVSKAAKIKGREPVLMHPDDASARNIAAGDIVRVFNSRGSCLAVTVIADGIRAGVAQMCTGAWFDPDDTVTTGSLCKHGNPNVLTLDKGTSRLAQGPIAHTCTVEVEKLATQAPEVTAFDPPTILDFTH